MPFISIEGIDGCGKSEQVTRLVEALKANGRTVVRTKEPDGGRLGLEVRTMLTREGRTLTKVEELLLIGAARYDHVRSVVRPALEAGHWVVSDRFFDSTFAFQVYGADTDLEPLFDAVTAAVVDGTIPNATIVLDLAEEIAAGRRTKRENEVSDPSEATRDFRAIRSGLLAAAARHPERCHVVDASRSIDDVAEEIWRVIRDLL